MKIDQIYTDYFVPVNLQKHMLRVAGLAEIILENWIGKKIDKVSIVQVSLIHDIAKPMNFDPAKQAKFGMTPSEIEKLDKLQKRLKTKYGSNEHHATVKICEEIGFNQIAIRLINNFEWKYIPRLLKDNDIESLIPIYCDMCIGPNGILPLEKRLNELQNRINSKDYEQKLKNGILLEELIKKNTAVNLNSITDKTINNRFENLLNLKV